MGERHVYADGTTGNSVAVAERPIMAATASAKGILEILREKGILSEEEYKQAVDEAQEQEKKAIQHATEEGKKGITLPDGCRSHIEV
jgi:hypothetical protein